MKDWYLLTNNTRPNLSSGFENDSFNDFADDAFAEILETDLASSVILYNSNLKNPREIRVVIQGKLADTHLKSMERKILAPIGTLAAGMYIYYKNNYWIVTGYPDDNSIYEKATLSLCQYKLKWQRDDGAIVERWANFTSASKYDIGENGNYTIRLSSNNFTIIIPDDDDSITLDNKRVFIDRNTSSPKKVFKITRSDDVLYLYGEHGGVLSFIADKTEMNPDTDRQDLGICDYIPPTTILPPTTSDNEDKFASIIFRGEPELKIGGNHKTFTGIIKSKENIQISDNGLWQIIMVDELKPYVDYIVTDNKIKIKIKNEEFAIGGLLRLIYSSTDKKCSYQLDVKINSSF